METPSAAERRNAAMRSYVASYLRANGSARTPCDENAVAYIRALRADIRRDEGGGGMCHVVTEVLEADKGWQRMSVTYLCPEGRVICAGHLVSLLADGTILDGTADQFGEGHDIRLLRPDDPEYGRYRPEFFEDWNPGIDPVGLAGWKADWSGTLDFALQDEVRAASGYGWWVEDTALLLEYCRAQHALAENGDLSYTGPLSAWISDLERRILSPAPG